MAFNRVVEAEGQLVDPERIEHHRRLLDRLWVGLVVGNRNEVSEC